MDSTKDGLVSESESGGYVEIHFARPDVIEATSRYQIKQELGRGGMGVVYRARDLNLQRDVAVKILLGEYLDSCKAANRFVSEARIMGMLEHPGIAHVYDYGTTEHGQPFHAMKLVEGKTLELLLAERGELVQLNAQLMSVFSHVCQTMAYTHSQHVIHLDLKPANIMVGAFGEVHVMDWGLARSVDGVELPPTRKRYRVAGDARNGSISQGVHGTLQYMAPEQARAEQVDKRTDVFCLGAILCEILTGSPPYLGDDRKLVWKMAREANLQPVYNQLDQSSREKPLIRLAKLCLQASPSDRPWDAAIVAKEIASYSELSLERLRSDINQFFDLSLDLFCIAGFDGFFRKINRNFSRVLGFSEQELMARPFMSFIHPDDEQSTVAAMAQLTAGQPVIRFRNRYVTKDNQEIEFEWTAKSVVNDNVIFAVARCVDQE